MGVVREPLLRFAEQFETGQVILNSAAQTSPHRLVGGRSQGLAVRTGSMASRVS